MRCAAALLSLVLALLAARAAAQEEALPTAASVTQRGRSLDRIFDMVLAGESGRQDEPRALTFLLDVTPSFERAELPATLFAAMERQAEALASTRIGIARVGRPARMLLAPTDDFAAVRRAVREVCREPSQRFQNVYEDLRRVLVTMGRQEGRREIVLVSFENGDLEDDLERTVAELEKDDVRFSAIAREAFLSDTYWVFRRQWTPRGTVLTGAEGAFVELPWGLRYQGPMGNLFAPSGFGMYGISRMAAVTGGRVFLFYPAPPAAHRCVHPKLGFCPFCDGDHEPQDEAYQAHRLRELAPLLGSRREVMHAMAGDPYGRAVLEAWEDLSRNQLCYSRPSVRRTVEGVKLERHPYKGWGRLGATTAYASERAQARRLRRALADIIETLEADLAEAETTGGLARFRAMADTLLVTLRLTDLNLVIFEAFCDEVAPVWDGAVAEDFEAPEAWPHREDVRWQWIHYQAMSLCHGPVPFRELHLPGGERTQAALEALIQVWEPFARRYAHTPFLLALRQAGIARFHLVASRTHVPWGRTSAGTETDETTTLPERPARPGPAGGGTTSGSGPTTGG